MSLSRPHPQKPRELQLLPQAGGVRQPRLGGGWALIGGRTLLSMIIMYVLVVTNDEYLKKLSFTPAEQCMIRGLMLPLACVYYMYMHTHTTCTTYMFMCRCVLEIVCCVVCRGRGGTTEAVRWSARGLPEISLRPKNTPHVHHW